MDERERVEDAVRRFLELAYSEAVEYESGIARRTVDVLLRASDVHPELAADVRRVVARAIDGSRAVADADAVITATFDHPVAGVVEQRRLVRGPVKLVREDDTWKVADYTADGRSLADSSWEPQGAVEFDGVVLSVQLVQLQRRATRVFVELHNARPRPLILVEAWRGRRSVGRWQWARVPLLGHRDVAAGGTATTYAGWRETFPLKSRELHLVCRMGEAGASGRIDIRVSITATGVELVERIPLNVRLSVVTRRRLAWLPLTVLAILILVRVFAAAAIVTLVWTLYLTLELATALKDERIGARQAASYLLGIAAMLLIAAFLFFL
jgi:hypothetical protein